MKKDEKSKNIDNTLKTKELILKQINTEQMS